MSFATETEKRWVWDRQQVRLVQKIRVVVSLVGNHGSVYGEAGPLFVETVPELFEATQLLRERLIRTLPSGVQ